MEKTITSEFFIKNRRELLLDYSSYIEHFSSIVNKCARVEKVLQQPIEKLEKIRLIDFSRAIHLRALDSLNQITISYSAGHEIKELHDFYPTILTYWEEYAKWEKAYDDSPQSEGAWVAHIPLLGTEYAQANRLICFAILLGHGNLLPRLMPIVDYRNPRTDGLLERLVAPFVSGRGTPPDDCMRHLPYFKTLKIFAAPKEMRPAMMAQYLEDWYHASRRETYHDSHERGTHFFGYWSWEAAAITFLLDIDDRSYADAMFYPKDLVDFARSVCATATPEATPPAEAQELRAKAGEPCPRAGHWESIDQPSQTRTYALGEPMLGLASAYGLTVWRYIDG